MADTPATETPETETAAEPHEWLMVAKHSTLARTCAYLRDLGIPILGHAQRSDGRWAVKVLREKAVLS